jgi:hypothetical protein
MAGRDCAARRIASLGHHIPCFDPQHATPRHGVPRIQGQIQQCSLELSRVDPDGRHIRIQFAGDVNRLSEGILD